MLKESLEQTIQQVPKLREKFNCLTSQYMSFLTSKLKEVNEEQHFQSDEVLFETINLFQGIGEHIDRLEYLIQEEELIGEIKKVNVGKLQNFSYKSLNYLVDDSFEKVCVLCQLPEFPSLGPIILAESCGRTHPVHELCLIWTRELQFFTNDGKRCEPKNLTNVVEMAQRNFCKACMKQGATLKCLKCDNQYHFACFMLKAKGGIVYKDHLLIQCSYHGKEFTLKKKKELQENDDVELLIKKLRVDESSAKLGVNLNDSTSNVEKLIKGQMMEFLNQYSQFQM